MILCGTATCFASEDHHRFPSLQAEFITLWFSTASEICTVQLCPISVRPQSLWCKIFSECLIHQINSVESSYLNIFVADTNFVEEGSCMCLILFYCSYFHCLSPAYCTSVNAIHFFFWIHVFLMALGKLIESKILDHSSRNLIIRDLFLLT